MTDTSIAFIDSSAHGAAIPFYKMFPSEPIPPATAKNSVSVDPQVVDIKGRRMETLLTAIPQKVKPGGSILIVCHGNDAGLFLSFGDPKNRIDLSSEVLAAIRQNTEGKADDTTTARLLMLTVAEWQRYKTLIVAVQKLELARVDLRACKTGHNDVTLSRLQVFFNCATACAPTIYDGFGIMNFGSPTPNPDVWRKWMDAHKGAQMKGVPPKRFAWHATYTPHFIIEAMADSQDAVQPWVEEHLPPGKYSGGPLYFHAFTDLMEQPIFAGDAAFRTKLVEAIKGQEPSRAIDVKNAPLPPP